jgi:hypothetical protein
MSTVQGYDDNQVEREWDACRSIVVACTDPTADVFTDIDGSKYEATDISTAIGALFIALSVLLMRSALVSHVGAGFSVWTWLLSLACLSSAVFGGYMLHVGLSSAKGGERN